MRCPKCGSLEDKVIDSRIHKDGTSIRRRRECLECHQRFTTTEEVVRDGLLVVKRDGRREEFDRTKMLTGIQRACEKRPVSAAQIDDIVTAIENEVSKKYEREVPTRVIGEMIMDRLKSVDKVAYVRFASVYREFKDPQDFVAAVEGAGR